MATLRLSNAEIYYEERGAGQPIVFVHGIWLSRAVFQKQVDDLSQNYRVITFDLRGHGRSEKVHSGHTINQYAKDLREVIEKLRLKDVILAGWSLGGNVVWEYLQQFGDSNVRASIVVAATPAEMNVEDWRDGAFDFAALRQAMTMIQTDRDAAAIEFVNSLFNAKPDEKTFEELLAAVRSQPESIAATILFDLAVQDYRGALPRIKVPTLLCYGARDSMASLEVGSFLHSQLVNSRLVAFEASGHSPHYEEAEKFNRETKDFIQSLSKAENPAEGV